MEEIKKLYKHMIENIPQFQEFKEKNKELSNDELIKKYNIEIIKQDN